MHTVAPPFAHSSGPRTARLAFCAEAFGEQEDMAGRPLIGNAGQEFTRLCNEAGIQRNECFLTNTIAARPPDNNFDAFCAKKSEVGNDYVLPAIKPGKYLRPELLPELDRLAAELAAVRPNLVVALGGIALWALCRTSAIGSNRGAVAVASLVPGQKVLPTYHPSYLFKVWQHRPIVLADLMKAKHESAFAEVRRPARQVLVRPALCEIEQWYKDHAEHAQVLSVDIETKYAQMSDIGFASSRSNAMVITLFDASGDLWSEEGEVEVRQWIARLLATRAKKLFQNGVFDLGFLMREGFRVRNCADDTMLLHHSMYPELQKGLGFLGSIYSQEPAWKLMVRHRKSDVLKADE